MEVNCLKKRELGINGSNDVWLTERAENELLTSKVSTKSCKIPPHSKAAYHVVLSPNGNNVASVHGDHNIYVCDVISGKLFHCLQGHTRTPWAIAYHPVRSDLLASGCLAGEVRVWDLKSGCCEVLLVDEQTAVASLAFHAEGRLLVIASGDRLLFWDWSQKYPFAECRTPSPKERVRFVKFDSSGTHLFTGIINPSQPVSGVSASSCNAYGMPPMMPTRCRELLRSRRELIQMRSDLSRRHSQLLSRYQELRDRYRALQQQYSSYPFVARPSDVSSPATTSSLASLSTEASLANLASTSATSSVMSRGRWQVLDIDEPGPSTSSQQNTLADVDVLNAPSPSYLDETEVDLEEFIRRHRTNINTGFVSPSPGASASQNSIGPQTQTRMGTTDPNFEALRQCYPNIVIDPSLTPDQIADRANRREEQIASLSSYSRLNTSPFIRHQNQDAFISPPPAAASFQSLANDLALAANAVDQSLDKRRRVTAAGNTISATYQRLQQLRQRIYGFDDQNEQENSVPRDRFEGDNVNAPVPMHMSDLLMPPLPPSVSGRNFVPDLLDSDLVRPIIQQGPVTYAEIMEVNPPSEAADRRQIERREQAIFQPGPSVAGPSWENLGPSTSGRPPPPAQTTTEPLSPICLENLHDTVAYAREISESSMLQFVRHHRESIARLQRSYMELSASAQRLVRMFQTTYDDMCRLQDEIDRNLGLTRERDHTREPAKRLLEALIKIQDILLKNAAAKPAPAPSAFEKHRHAYLLNETETLLEVYRTLIANLDGLEFPQGSVQQLREGQTRIAVLFEELNRTPPPQTIMAGGNSDRLSRLQQQLVEEVQCFQMFVRRWKNLVIDRIRDGTFRLPIGPDPAAPSTSQELGPSGVVAATNADIKATAAPPQSFSKALADMRPMHRNSESGGPSNVSFSTAATAGSSSGASGETEVSFATARKRARELLSEIEESSSTNKSRKLDQPSQSSSSAYSPDGNSQASLSKSGELKNETVAHQAPQVIAQELKELESSVEISIVQDEPLPRQPSTVVTHSIADNARSRVVSVSDLSLRSDAATRQRRDSTQPSRTAVEALRERWMELTRLRSEMQARHATLRRDRHVTFNEGRATERRGGNVQEVEPTALDELGQNVLRRLNARRRRAEQDRDSSDEGFERLRGIIRRRALARRSHLREARLNRYSFSSLYNSRRHSFTSSSSTNVPSFSTSNSTSITSIAPSQSTMATASFTSSSISLHSYSVSPQSAGITASQSFSTTLSSSQNQSINQPSTSISIGIGAMIDQIGSASAFVPMSSSQSSFVRADASRQSFSERRILSRHIRSGSENSLAAAIRAAEAARHGLLNDADLRSESPRDDMFWASPEPVPVLRRPEAEPPGPPPIPPPPLIDEDEDREGSYDLHRAVNRAIAGAFVGTGDIAIANNILDLTARIHMWPFNLSQLPDLKNSSANVIVPRCKLHNDGSVSISQCGQFMAVFVDSGERRALWADTLLQILSLRPYDRGTVLFSKSFGPNAVSVALSPTSCHVLVGLASRRYLRDTFANQTYGQVLRLEFNKDADKQLLKPMMNLEYDASDESMEDTIFPGAGQLGLSIRRISLNCAIWLAMPGQGFLYATNKGRICVVTPTWQGAIGVVGNSSPPSRRRFLGRRRARPFLAFGSDSDSD